jgi:hypothetical protein
MFKKTKLKLIFTASDVITANGVTGSSAVTGQLLPCANRIYFLFCEILISLMPFLTVRYEDDLFIRGIRKIAKCDY